MGISIADCSWRIDRESLVQSDAPLCAGDRKAMTRGRRRSGYRESPRRRPPANLPVSDSTQSLESPFREAAFFRVGPRGEPVATEKMSPATGQQFLQYFRLGLSMQVRPTQLRVSRQDGNCPTDQSYYGFGEFSKRHG